MRQPPENSATLRSRSLVREPQAIEKRRGARARGIAVAMCERFVRDGEALAIARGFGLGDFALSAAERFIAVDDELDRRTLERGGLLRHVRDRPAGRQLEVAAVGVELAAQQREQARFPAAVRPDDTDPLAGMEREIGGFEEHLRAAPERRPSAE